MDTQYCRDCGGSGLVEPDEYNLDWVEPCDACEGTGLYEPEGECDY